MDGSTGLAAVLVLGIAIGIAGCGGGGESSVDAARVDARAVPDAELPDAGAPDAMPDEPRFHTLVVYNPTNPDSQGVADYYAAFRQIDPDRLCAAAAPNIDVLDTADADPFFAAVQACRDAAEAGGADIQYLVPVYG